MTAAERRRYPGWRSFADDELERRLFFGRERERGDLLHLVLGHDLVVLFARSGAGKTSLVNVALMQPLRDAHGAEGEALSAARPPLAPACYFPVVARVNHQDGPAIGVRTGIQDAANKWGLECEAPAGPTSIGDYFRQLRLWSGDRLLVPVLILDQFEELFTVQKEERRGPFLRELGQLLRTEDHRIGAPCLKLVISMREDFLGSLEALSAQLPSVFNTRFRLDGLRREDARRAIEGPAELEDPSLVTAPFEYAKGTVDGMLDFLCRPRPGGGEARTNEVEPFQLQLVCEHAEEVSLGRQRSGRPRSPLTYDDLGADAGLRGVLGSYYERQIAGRADARRIHALVEQGLISPRGRRLSLEEGQIVDDYKVPAETLRFLVDRHILRAEPRLDSTWYELSHDTLIQPILKARHARIARQTRRRILTVGLAVAVLALAAFLVKQTPWFQVRRAFVEGDSLVEQLVRQGAPGEADGWRAQWSRVLAWRGRIQPAAEMAKDIEDDRLRAQAFLNLLAAPVAGAGNQDDALIDRFKRAAVQVRDVRDRVHLVVAAAESPGAMRAGHRDDLLQAALRTARESADPFEAAEAMAVVADTWQKAGNKGEAVSTLREAAERGLGVSDALNGFIRTLQTAGALWRAGEPEAARDLIGKARLLSMSSGLQDPRAAVLLAEGVATMDSPQETAAAIRGAGQSLERATDPRIGCEGLAALQGTARKAGLVAEAHTLADRTIRVCTPLPLGGVAPLLNMLEALLDDEANRDSATLSRLLAAFKGIQGPTRFDGLAGASSVLAKVKHARAPEFAQRALDTARRLPISERRQALVIAASSDWMLPSGVSLRGVWTEAIEATDDRWERFETAVSGSKRLSELDPEGGRAMLALAEQGVNDLPPEKKDEAVQTIVTLKIDTGGAQEAARLAKSLPAPLSDELRTRLLDASLRGALSPEGSEKWQSLRTARTLAEGFPDPDKRSRGVGAVAVALARLGSLSEARGISAGCARLADRLRVQIEVLWSDLARARPDLQAQIDENRIEGGSAGLTGGGGF